MIHPKDAIKFCPYCGSEKFKFRNDLSFICTKCDKELFINAASSVVAVIYDDQRRLLFCTRGRDPHKGMLDLPGGFIDPGETAEIALHREMKEELGKNVISHSYLGSYTNEYPYGGLTYYTLDLVFECKLDSYENISAMDDVSAVEFISPETVDIDSIGSESIKNIVKSIIKKN
ncbi:MAG: NUDIX domain-containing protein [Pseudomonadota bacterium]